MYLKKKLIIDCVDIGTHKSSKIFVVLQGGRFLRTIFGRSYIYIYKVIATIGYSFSRTHKNEKERVINIPR